MANNTLDKAIEAIPYFGKRIKLFTKNGNGTCCCLFKYFFYCLVCSYHIIVLLVSFDF